jgi:hypothetical protein
MMLRASAIDVGVLPLGKGFVCHYVAMKLHREMIEGPKAFGRFHRAAWVMTALPKGARFAGPGRERQAREEKPAACRA